MTDHDLIEKKLAHIETCVRDLRVRCVPSALADDIVQARFAEYTLQMAIQAAMDVASHIVSEERLGEPRDNKDLFARLAREGWVDRRQCDVLVAMVGFRNVLVHEYAEVDIDRVRQVVEHELGDLLAFVTAIRRRLRPG